MKHKKISKTYSAEFRERAVRMLIEHLSEHASEFAALVAIYKKLGCSVDSLRSWSHQQQRDSCERAGPTSTETARIKELEREVRELRQANLQSTASCPVHILR